jgi:hypothetical protein
MQQTGIGLVQSASLAQRSSVSQPVHGLVLQLLEVGEATEVQHLTLPGLRVPVQV